MEVQKIKKEEYKELFSVPYHIFNKLEFNQLNSEVRDIQIDCLGFKSKKYKLGIIGDIIDNKFKSPFSAPFGGFSYKSDDVSIETIDKAVALLEEYCRFNALSEIQLTLPPFFYATSFISKMGNALYRKNFTLANNDLNYSIYLNGQLQAYEESLQYNARKNLAIANTKPFMFTKGETKEEKALAYSIIQKNREARGFPLRMTLENVLNTIQIIEADFFTVHLAEEPVAAAIVFHVAPGIVQVIYWGDLPEYGLNKTMNFLSYNVVKHYAEAGIKVIGIGPSTEDSIPNYGLCDFKESIGCSVVPKFSFREVLC